MQDGDYYNDCVGDYKDGGFHKEADDGKSYKILRRNSR